MKPVNVLAVAIALCLCASAESENRVSASLHAEGLPGGLFRVGVLYRLPGHAHIYWRNSGTSGIPTGIEWTLPEGWTAGPLQWPAPQRFEDPVINDISYGYENEVMLFSEIAVPETAPMEPAPVIKADTYWLVCLEDGECIPETAELSIVPSTGNSLDSKIIQHYADNVPRTLSGSGLPITAKIAAGKDARMEILLKKGWTLAKDEVEPTFFPYSGEAWTLAESDAERMVFRRTAGTPGFAAGVVRIFMRNAEGVLKTVCFEVGIPPDSTD